MDIDTLDPADEPTLEAAAALIVAAFRPHYARWWPDLASGRAEVQEMLSPDRICRAAFDEDGQLVGLIGGIPHYLGNVWELHPLAVRPDRQRQGIGRALVRDLEAQARARGGLTIYLGSDDEDSLTSLGGVDLYPDPWPHIAGIRNLGGHPYEFYQKLGYVIVGVVPDANGRGKPDIMLARRLDDLPAP